MNSLWKLLMAPMYKFLSMFHGLKVLLYIHKGLLKGRHVQNNVLYFCVKQYLILTSLCWKYGVISITLKMMIRNAWNMYWSRYIFFFL